MQSLHVNFDHANKLLSFSSPHTHVGAVTFGQAIIGMTQPRTPASYIPEFEASLPSQRLSVQEFARTLSLFFLQQWQAQMLAAYTGPDMLFMVGGFDEGAAYGRVFKFGIPSAPIPIEQNPDPQFGVIWGGQQEIVDRLIMGYDPNLPVIVAEALELDPEETAALKQRLAALQLPLPIGFYGLQDCVDLAILMIRTTIAVQQLTVTLRGVGGPIDVATITRQGGLTFVQRKQIVGEAGL